MQWVCGTGTARSRAARCRFTVVSCTTSVRGRTAVRHASTTWLLANQPMVGTIMALLLFRHAQEIRGSLCTEIRPVITNRLTCDLDYGV